MRRFFTLTHVLFGSALALPLLISAGLGFVWLYQNGWLLWFAGGTVAFVAVMRVVGWAVARRQTQQAATTLQGPDPDPAWTDAQTAAFERARARITQRVQAPLDWPLLPSEAMGVVQDVASDLSQGKRTALDFTLPEALLLIDRVALRYRTFLLSHVPFADTLSVRMMHWAWRKQDDALLAWETGFLAWRGVRLLTNPIAGVMREAERALARGLQGQLTEAMRRDAQIILLEEAAQAAIDLYSGRLKASDAELSALADRAGRDPAPLAPVRVLVVGQQGAGTSALMAGVVSDPGTQALAPIPQDRVDSIVAGVRVELIEHKLSANAAADVAALLGADLILWAHRATRPGRAPDHDLLTALAAVDPLRVPPILHVMTGAAGLSESQRAKAADSLTSALGIAPPLPVALGQQVENLPELHRQISAALPLAQRAQRARLLESAGKGGGVRRNLGRLGRAGQAVLGRLRSR